MSLAVRLLPILAARRRMSAGLSAASAIVAAVGNGPFTTPAVTAQPMGGVGPYTYAWSRVSGDASISVSNAALAAPTWSASGTAPQTKGASWQCSVTDARGIVVQTGTVDVQVQFQVPSLSVNVDHSSASIAGNGNGPFTTPAITASPVGGSGPFTYLWQYVSGDASIAVSSAAAAAPTWSASGTAPQTKTAVWRCQVTDHLGTVAYSQNVTISVECDVPAMSVSVDGFFCFGYGASNNSAISVFSDYDSVTPTGGIGPYTYSWELLSGDAIIPESINSATTRWVAVRTPYAYLHSYWRCKVQDSVGTVAYSPTVQVDLQFDSAR